MSVDHRELGRDLEFFATTPIVGAGLPLWLPDGAVIRNELEKFAAEQAARSGCQGVYTPVMAKKELYERSGHWSKFSEDMFPEMKIGESHFSFVRLTVLITLRYSPLAVVVIASYLSVFVNSARCSVVNSPEFSAD